MSKTVYRDYSTDTIVLEMSNEDFKALYYACLVNRDKSSSFDDLAHFLADLW